jgi:hypothetical protein
MNLDSPTNKRRTTFSSLVPESTRRELAERLLCERDSAARTALFDDYQLDRRYGVSRMQFRRFSNRFPCSLEAVPVASPPAIAEADGPAAPPAPSIAPSLADGYRAWLTRAGAVLAQQAERLSDDNPEAWEHGARAALVARVVAVLAGDRTGPSMHEVLTASRILLEQRSAPANPEPAGRKASGPAKNARCQSEDAEITLDVMHKAVRDLYGGDIQNAQPFRGPVAPREGSCTAARAPSSADAP